MVSEVAKRIGREPTAREMMQGFVDASQDSRSSIEKMQDSDWRPKLRTQPSNIERMLEETQDEIDKRNPYKGMDQLEARRHDLERILDREAEEKLAAEEKTKHLEKVQPKVELLNNLINQENWSNESDAGFRSLLRRTREQVLHPDGDRLETLRMLKQVDAVIEDRRQQQSKQLEAQAATLADQLAKNQTQQASLADGMEGTENAGE